jgi:hypothetical protein
MGLDRRDKEFRHEGVSYLDYKQVEMDRVLTAFLARLWWGGQRSVISRTRDLTVEDFVATFEEHPDAFQGFDPSVTRRWVETHLVDMVSRGKPSEAVAGLRPLHGFTYRFRNGRRSRSYGADEQLYEMLSHAKASGGVALDGLKDFFFAGVDARTEAPRLGAEIDVETQALINLSEAVRGQITDRPVTDRDRRSYPPLYQEASDLLANDVLRLLYHRHLIPRTVLVDYLKILFAFHLALYHLKIMKLLPVMIRGDRPSADGSFFLDVTGLLESGAARLAEVSATAWFGRIPEFVRATFTLKKLDNLAEHLARRGQLSRPSGGYFAVGDLLGLLGQRYRQERTTYAAGRLTAIEASRPPDEDEDPAVAQLLQLGLDEFTTYVEVVTHYRVKFHRQYLTQCLDTLLLKNRPGAMITQPRNGMRRFTLDSRLLEVLLQLSLLSPDSFGTVPLRVDEFLAVLRDRYGLYIDQLPEGDGFGPAIITDHAALRENRAAFIARLREIGFYSDQSDAYLTQTITPRYIIEANLGAAT